MSKLEHTMNKKLEDLGKVVEGIHTSIKDKIDENDSNSKIVAVEDSVLKLVETM